MTATASRATRLTGRQPEAAEAVAHRPPLPRVPLDARGTAWARSRPDAQPPPALAELHDVPRRRPRLQPVAEAPEVGGDGELKNPILLAALLPALPLAGAALAQDVPLDVELGYRWTDVSGNDDMYRSQINERDWTVRLSASGLGDFDDAIAVDHFRIDAADVGTGPESLFRVEVGRTGYYTLNASCSRQPLLDVPTFANPLLHNGTVNSQHPSDRTRTPSTSSSSSCPARRSRPSSGTATPNEGPGATTYHLGENEFQLEQDLTEKETECRVGVAFDFGPVTGPVIQGWRTFKGEGRPTLRRAGTATTPRRSWATRSRDLLGRTSMNDVNTPLTSAVVTGSSVGRPAHRHLRPSNSDGRTTVPRSRGELRLVQDPALLQDPAGQTGRPRTRATREEASGRTSTSSPAST